MSTIPATPKPASTLILVRDGAAGLEVFMMGRTDKAAAFAGAYVFPGGSVDAADQPEHWRDLALDDAGASKLLNLPQGGLAYWIAAIRECFEESGLLLACDQHDQLLDLSDPADAAEYDGLRKQAIAGELGFDELCRACNLRPALDRLAYFSHWITPVAAPRRFDTRFFVALAPQHQVGSHDDGETVSNEWVRPAEALQRFRSGELHLIFPTVKTLEALAEHGSAAAVVEHARQLQSVPVILPRRATGRAGTRSLLPHEHAYAEVGKLDPAGQGTAAYEIIPGVLTRLSPTVRRLTAPNPGFMTGPGTNSYLLGNGDVAVIDPGPASAAHIDTLVAEAGGRVRWIFVTHTHPDHSPGAALLKARTGAQLFGIVAPEGEHQDAGFTPDMQPAHGDRFTLGPGITLRAIHTPGHASNHLCYLLEEEKILFTGDHIMQGSTVVIAPPDGDMSAYFASLRALQDEALDYIAPGHGFLIDQPQRMVEQLLAHRKAREDKIVRALSAMGQAGVEALVTEVYDDVPAAIHPVAQRSLLAHLLKLQAEARADETQGLWTARS